MLYNILCGHMYLRFSTDSPGTIWKIYRNECPMIFQNENSLRMFCGYNLLFGYSIYYNSCRCTIYYDNATSRKRRNSRKYDFGNLPRYKLTARAEGTTVLSTHWRDVDEITRDRTQFLDWIDRIYIYSFRTENE